MSRVVVQSLEGTVNYAFSLMNKFVEVCPDEIWAKKCGGWPVWQQVYHSFAAIDFFLRLPDDAPEAPPYAEEVGNLDAPAKDTVSKAQLKPYIGNAQARVKNYISSLGDAELAEAHPGLSQRMGATTTHAGTVALIAAHTMYHLGSCDAALREHGLPGVF